MPFCATSRPTKSRPVRDFDEASLQSALARLVDAGLLFVDGVPPEATYSFKHALIQDAAYDSLLRSRRQALHKRAATALIAAQSEPEAIAHHFTAAGAKVWRSSGGAMRAKTHCAVRPSRRRWPILARRSRLPKKRNEKLLAKRRKIRLCPSGA